MSVSEWVGGDDGFLDDKKFKEARCAIVKLRYMKRNCGGLLIGQGRMLRVHVIQHGGQSGRFCLRRGATVTGKV